MAALCRHRTPRAAPLQLRHSKSTNAHGIDTDGIALFTITNIAWENILDSLPWLVFLVCLDLFFFLIFLCFGMTLQSASTSPEIRINCRIWH